MEEWKLMFRFLGSITLSAKSMEDGIYRMAQFAQRYPQTFDEPDFWKNVGEDYLGFPYQKIVRWANDSLIRRYSMSDWDILWLNLGDCPESFHLYQLGYQPYLDEERFKDAISSSNDFVGFDEVDACIKEEWKEFENSLLDLSLKTWESHNVRELNDPLISWNRHKHPDHHGHHSWNGEILWLVLGSLAMLEPLFNLHYCRSILHGSKRLYLMSGFEEIFTCLGTVTQMGLQLSESLGGNEFLNSPNIQLPLSIIT